MKWFPFLFLVIILGCGSGGSSKNKILVSTPISQKSNFFLCVPSEFTSIKDALGRASVGDTVLISDGLFIEDVEVRDGVNIIGNPVGTKIYGTISANHLRNETKISGLQVVDSLVTAKLVESKVVFNYCTFLTGNVEVRNSSAIFTNCTFVGDSSLGNAMRVVSGFTTIRNSIFDSWDTCLTSSPGAQVAGRVDDSLFFNYNQIVSGNFSFFGDKVLSDPLFTDRTQNKFYLNDASPAIKNSDTYYGAWRPAHIRAQPIVLVNILSGSPAPAPQLTKVLVAQISCRSKNLHGKILIDSLILEIRVSQPSPQVMRWLLVETRPVFGNIPLGSSRMYVKNDTLTFRLFYPLEIKTGETKIVELSVDISHLIQGGDTFEATLKALEWRDGSLLTNISEKNVGLPASGGVFTTP